MPQLSTFQVLTRWRTRRVLRAGSRVSNPVIRGGACNAQAFGHNATRGVSQGVYEHPSGVFDRSGVRMALIPTHNIITTSPTLLAWLPAHTSVLDRVRMWTMSTRQPLRSRLYTALSMAGAQTKSI